MDLVEASTLTNFIQARSCHLLPPPWVTQNPRLTTLVVHFYRAHFPPPREIQRPPCLAVLSHAGNPHRCIRKLFMCFLFKSIRLHAVSLSQCLLVRIERWVSVVLVWISSNLWLPSNCPTKAGPICCSRMFSKAYPWPEEARHLISQRALYRNQMWYTAIVMALAASKLDSSLNFTTFVIWRFTIPQLYVK